MRTQCIKLTKVSKCRGCSCIDQYKAGKSTVIPEVCLVSVLVLRPTVSSASLLEGMDDAVICRRGGLWGEESFKPVAAQPKGMSLVQHKGFWVGWVRSHCVLWHGYLGVICHIQSRPALLGQWSKGGCLCAWFTPQRTHWFERGLSVDTQKSASVKTQLAAHGVAWMRSGRFLFGAPGDPGCSPAPGCPGQQDIDQSTQQQAHKHR